MKSHPLEGQSIAKLHGYRYGIVPDTGMGMGSGIHHFLKNICGTQWILDIGMSIWYDTDTGMWAKMEYLCNGEDNGEEDDVM